MIGQLPTQLEIGGELYAIRSDFRVVLTIFSAFNDERLNDHQKAYVCLKCLFENPEKIPKERLSEAINKAYWFLGGGGRQGLKDTPDNIKTFDWEQDEHILFPAINKVAGGEIRNSEYMHWWTLLGYFGEIDDGLFSTVMHIRHKRAKGKKLDKWEQEIYKQNKDIINLVSPKDKKAISETEEFLKTIT